MACRKTCLLKSSCKVSQCSMSRKFDDVLCVDHQFFNDVSVFPASDTATGYSACAISRNNPLSAALISFDASCLNSFQPPPTVYGDRASIMMSSRTILLQMRSPFAQTLRAYIATMCLNPRIALSKSFLFGCKIERSPIRQSLLSKRF